MNDSGSCYGFIGLGLIGGSLAKKLRDVNPMCRILACSRSMETAETALKEGIIDQICSAPDDPSYSSCDIIFLCAPTETNLNALHLLKRVLSPGTLVTDVGSVKGPICKAAAELGISGQFVGGHPMTGSEKSGLSYSNDHLFENTYYILTPAQDTPQTMTDTLYQIVLSLNAVPLILDPDEHDRITAAISHLPHVIASSLVNTVHDLDSEDHHMKTIAAGGFRDITRIASSSPAMWESICVENHENIAAVMDVFLDKLIAARDHMCKGDGGYINRMFVNSRAYRDSFTFASPAPGGKIHRIFCDIIDENGAIATVATLLAVNGISIRNMSILHNREFEQGVLTIEFYDDQAKCKAAELLRYHRYLVWEPD